MKAEIVKEQTFYEHMLIKDSDDGPFSLFVRRYTARRGPKTGKVRVQIQRDVQVFDDPDSLERGTRDMRELPAAAEADLGYLPEEFRGL
jgi:hypothetical protein